MYIRQIEPKKSIAFGKINNDYKSEDIKARETIRTAMENQWGGAYAYSHEIGTMSKAEIEARIRRYSSREFNPKTGIIIKKSQHVGSEKKQKDVNTELLEEQKIYAFRERVKNHIYSGERLSEKPEAVTALKEAGIKSVLCLLPFEEEYKANAKKEGLNYIELNKIGNKTLGVFNFDIVDELTKKPEMYTEDGNKNIEDLKAFVDLVNGENKDFPNPLYMGCQWGTNRTYEWYSISQILKDQPKDEPLTQENKKQLSELLNIIYADRRY